MFHLSDLSESERRIVDAMTFHMETMKNELFAKIAEKDLVIETLNCEVVSLKATVSRLEEQIDEGEAYQRRETLLFSGRSLPLFSSNENTTEVLSRVLLDKLKYKLPKDSVSISHRLGPIPTRGEDRRSIIAKLCRRDLKTDILKAAKTVKPENLYINESLTPVRRTIHYVLRKARKKYPEKITGISTLDGKVIVYVKPNRANRNSRDIKFIINSRAKLDKFCNDILSTPLTTLFDGDW